MLAILLGLLSASCSGGDPATGAGETISSEAFVEAFVALRTSPALGPAGYLPAGEPERVLAEQGLVPDDLRRFVEIHGQDVPFMTEIWTEIESRLAPAAPPDEPPISGN